MRSFYHTSGTYHCFSVVTFDCVPAVCIPKFLLASLHQKNFWFLVKLWPLGYLCSLILLNFDLWCMLTAPSLSMAKRKKPIPEYTAKAWVPYIFCALPLQSSSNKILFVSDSSLKRSSEWKSRWEFVFLYYLERWCISWSIPYYSACSISYHTPVFLRRVLLFL